MYPNCSKEAEHASGFASDTARSPAPLTALAHYLANRLVQAPYALTPIHTNFDAPYPYC